MFSMQIQFQLVTAVTNYSGYSSASQLNSKTGSIKRTFLLKSREGRKWRGVEKFSFRELIQYRERERKRKGGGVRIYPSKIFHFHNPGPRSPFEVALKLLPRPREAQSVSGSEWPRDRITPLLTAACRRSLPVSRSASW